MSNLYGEKDTPREISIEYKNFTDAIESRVFEEIIKNLNDMTQKYADRPELFALMATIYEFENKYEKALLNHNKSIALGKNNASYYHNRADWYFRSGKFASSLHDFEYIIKRTDLLNREYYLSDSHTFRLLAACCLGEWDIAKEEIGALKDDYIFYYNPINGRIDKQRLLKVIEDKNRYWIMP